MQRLSQHRWVASGVLAALLAAAAVVYVLPIVESLVGIFFVHHPNDGWSDGVMADAKAIAVGHFPYGNPATQWVSQLYTPLFDFLVAGLLRIWWWEGWGPVVSMVATLVSAGYVSHLGVRNIAGRWARIAVAGSVMALALGALSVDPRNGVYEARTDQLAWCFMVIAGTLVFGPMVGGTAARGARNALAGLLLMAALYTKQTTVVPCVVIALSAGVGTLLFHQNTSNKLRAFARAVVCAATFGVSSAAVLGALQLASHGYAFDLIAGLPQRQAKVMSLSPALNVTTHFLAFPLAAMALTIIVAIASVIRRPSERGRGFGVLACAVVLGLCSIPTAALAYSKQGGDINQFAGPIWCLSIAVAIGFSYIPSIRWRSGVATVTVAAILIGSIGPVGAKLLAHGIPPPTIQQRTVWHEIPRNLVITAEREASQGKAIFTVHYLSESVSKADPRSPAEFSVLDLTSGGYAPRWLVRQLLDGAYAYVAPLSAGLGPYMSGLGTYDGSITWKIDLLITKGYRLQSSGPMKGYYAPAPALKRLGWFYNCFGPYQARGISVRLRANGGLVCLSGGRLRLLEAPQPMAELVAALQAGSELAVRYVGSTPQVTVLSSGDLPITLTPVTPLSTSAEARCVIVRHGVSQLLIRADAAVRNLSCLGNGNRKTLAVPSDGAAGAHLSIFLASNSHPAVIALASGREVPFGLENPSPAETG